jgi:YVTN family beta-propeller protein
MFPTSCVGSNFYVRRVVLFSFFIYDIIMDILVHSLVHLEYTLKNMEFTDRVAVAAKEVKRAYITDQDTVVVINARTKEVIRDSSQRQSISLSEKNRSYMITGTVVRSIDTNTGKVIKRIPIGTEEKPPSSILAISGNKTQLYVVNRADRKIFVIDTDMDEVIDTIPVEESEPSRIANAVETKEMMEDSKFSREVAHVQEPGVVEYGYGMPVKEATVPEDKAKDLESWPLLGGKEVAKYKMKRAWTTAVSFVIASKMKVAIATSVLLVVAVVITVIAVAVVPKPIPPQCKMPVAYVTNYGDNTISVIDTNTNLVLATIPVGTTPDAVAVTPDGTRIYVTNLGSNTVSVIDTATNLVLTTFDMNQPTSVEISPDGTWAYVTSYLSSGNTISIIATATNQVMFIIPLSVIYPAAPIGVVVTLDGTRVYVAYSRSSTVSVIDTIEKLESGTISVGDGSNGIAITPDGTRIYVACSTRGTYVIDTVTNQVKGIIPVLAGSFPTGVAFSPDGKQAYVANFGSGSGNAVTVFDTAFILMLANIQIGPVYPIQGVAVSLDGTRAYVTHYWNYTVSVINTASYAVIGTISVGFMPSKIKTACISL